MSGRIEYDREWTTPSGSRARKRLGYSHDRGHVTRFVVQLEYRLGGEWVEVVRSDHDEEGEFAHDVTDEGLHLDVFRDGEKVDTDQLTGPLPADVGFTLAEEHLAEHAERYVTRFEQWHKTDRTDT